jgi:hypothetical protein
MRCTGIDFRSSTARPDRTERFCSVGAAFETKRSLCLISSQLFFCLVRTSANEPFTFSPRRKKLSLPRSSSSRTRRSACARSWNAYCAPSSGEYTPQSQTIISPAPYWPGGITPSNEA